MRRLQNLYFVLGVAGALWSPFVSAAGQGFDAFLLAITSFALIEASTREEWK